MRLNRKLLKTILFLLIYNILAYILFRLKRLLLSPLVVVEVVMVKVNDGVYVFPIKVVRSSLPELL